MKKCFLIILAFLFIAWLPSVYRGQADASSELTASAKSFVDLFMKKDFPSVVDRFDATMKNLFTPEKMLEVWDDLIAKSGAYKLQTSTRSEEKSGYKIIVVTGEFEKATMEINVVFDKEKKIAGMFFTPVRKEYESPGYVKQNSFREQDVTVGSGEWALSGTLTLPGGTGPFPAVVLVHGSGANDRDETIGQTKVFRDLAGGLASRGIAVLRYEKRSLQHAGKFNVLPRFTVKEEVLDDAAAAIDLLRNSKGIDPKKIFVIGHSLGGMLVPRLGKLKPEVAGLIAMAGPARPLEDIILEQTIYLSSFDGNISKAEQEEIDTTKKRIQTVKNFKAADAASAAFVYGAPAAYWLDLQGYDPPKAAALLKQQRLLILQGERDYQVTMVDFGAWKKALSSNANVAFKSYPGLNHHFVEGKEKSIPAEYDTPGHVAEIVINDIAAWIKK